MLGLVLTAQLIQHGAISPRYNRHAQWDCLFLMSNNKTLFSRLQPAISGNVCAIIA